MHAIENDSVVSDKLHVPCAVKTHEMLCVLQEFAPVHWKERSI